MRALELSDVAKAFGGQPVLASVSLSLEPGEIVWLRGENGAGKSTLLDVTAGVLEPDRGSILVRGIARSDRRAALAHVGYAPSNAALPDALAIHELLDLVAALRGGVSAREVDGIAARWALDGITSERVSVLSLGQRRRLVLALSELGGPSVRLLDEPTVGLDAEGRALLVERLRAHAKQGGAVLVASHEDALADALGARTLSLRAGRIEER